MKQRSSIRQEAPRYAATAGREHRVEDSGASAAAAPLPFSVAEVRAARKAPPEGRASLGSLAAVAATRYSVRAVSPKLVADVLRICEWGVLVAVSFGVLAALGLRPGLPMFWQYAAISVCGAVAGVAGIHTFGGYEIRALRRGLSQLALVAGGWAVALAALTLGLQLTTSAGEIVPDWLPLWYASGLGALVIGRSALSRRVRDWMEAGRMERRAVIVGGGQPAETVIRALEGEDSGIRICGIFDDRGNRRSPPRVAGYPKLGNVSELVEFTRRAHIDMLIVTIPLAAHERVLELLKTLWVLPLDIRLFGARPGTSTPDGGVPMVRAFDKPIGDWGAIGKRVFDLTLACAALLMLAPVFLATMIAIKLDSKGPIFFRQKRHGFNNQVIDVLKFRSMYADAADPAAKRVVTKGDPRVTRVGRFIRKSSIDELPQLWNVVQGELSLVGPRPHAVHAQSSRNEAFIEIVDDYFSRHKVKPGITGWAQINGFRGEIDHPAKLQARFEHDLEYIENWSILFDLAILCRTPFSLLNTENAY